MNTAQKLPTTLCQPKVTDRAEQSTPGPMADNTILTAMATKPMFPKEGLDGKPNNKKPLPQAKRGF